MLQTAIAPRSTPDLARRRRFARTFARARWGEYEQLLGHAVVRQYQIISLERFVTGPPGDGRALLVLRHDVDQHPRSALTMAAIEKAAGLTSTWYFRWRTADPLVIHRLQADGFEIGLHYETLTRRLLETKGCPNAVDQVLLESCRQELSAEIDAFVGRFGPIVSVCPHGDTRVPGVYNGLLLRDQLHQLGARVIDCNEAMRGRELAAWITDRSAPDGGWGNGVDPIAVLDSGATPLLCLTHPNNWAGGSGLLLDRIASVLLPDGFPTVPIRTRSDRPSI